MVDLNLKNSEDESDLNFLFKPSKIQAQHKIRLPDDIRELISKIDTSHIYWSYHEEGYVLISSYPDFPDKYKDPGIDSKLGERIRIPQGIRDNTYFGNLTQSDIVYFYTDKDLITYNDFKIDRRVYIFPFSEQQMYQMLDDMGFEGFNATAHSLDYIGVLNQEEKLKKKINECSTQIKRIERLIEHNKSSEKSDENFIRSLKNKKQKLVEERSSLSQQHENLKNESEESDDEDFQQQTEIM